MALSLSVFWLLPSLARAGSPEVAWQAAMGELGPFGWRSFVEQVELQWGEACAEGYTPTCDTGAWRRDGEAHVIQLARLLAPRCGPDDGLACAVDIWASIVAGAPIDPADLDALSAACDAGDLHACDTWAGLLAAGLRGPERVGLGIGRLAARCESGVAVACGYLGRSYAEGGDFVAALPFLGQGCAGGDPVSCANLAAMAEAEVIVDADREGLLTLACGGGVWVACTQLGREKLAAGDVDLGLAVLDRGCRMGSAEACMVAVDVLREQGRTAAEPDVALSWLSLARRWIAAADGPPVDLAHVAVRHALLHRDMAWYPQTIRSADEVLVLLAAEPEHPLVFNARLLRNHAEWMSDVGDLAELDALLLAAAAQGPTEQRALITDLSRLAEGLSAELDHDRALALSERAVALCQQVAPGDCAEALVTLASARAAAGSLTRASLDLQAAEAQITDATPVAVRKDLANTAAVLALLMGDPASARARLEQLVAASDAPSCKDATLLGNLAGVEAEQGDYALAGARLEQAIALIRQTCGPEDPRLASLLVNQGSMFSWFEDWDRAEANFVEALDIRTRALGADHPDSVTVEVLLAVLAWRRAPDDDTQAIQDLVTRLESAVARLERGAGAERQALAVTLSLLATAELELGLVERAIARLQRAEAIYTANYGPDSQRTASITISLAGALLRTGDVAGARQRYQRVLAVQTRALGELHMETAATRAALADLDWRAGDRARAREGYAAAVRAEETVLARQLPPASPARRRGVLASVSPAAERLLWLHLHAQPGDADGALPALEALLQRKGRLLDADADGLDAARASLDEAGQADFTAWQARLAALDAALTRGPDADPALWQTHIAELTHEVAALEESLARRSAAFAAERAPVTAAAVAAALPPGAALVEYVRLETWDPATGEDGEPRYAAAVMGRETPAWVDLGPAAPIDAAVELLRRSILARGAVPVEARAAWDLVWAPVEPLLGEATSVLVAPDGALNLLPFDALLGPDGRWLMERIDLSLLTSGRDLLRPSVISVPGPALVVAAPDYDATQQDAPSSPLPVAALRGEELPRGLLGVTWRPLAGAKAEGKAVSRLLVGSALWTGAEATETALKSVASPAVLHVATHGFYLDTPATRGSRGVALVEPEAPAPVRSALLQSGVVLAGANHPGEGADNGILTAAELAGLDLRGTRLAVLSACQTGLGVVEAGQGVAGLRRSLSVAGAQAAVLSLWAVDDKATERLMKRFYEELVAGQSVSVSLRAARQAILADPRTASPYYWAAFAASGRTWGGL